MPWIEVCSKFAPSVKAFQALKFVGMASVSLRCSGRKGSHSIAFPFLVFLPAILLLTSLSPKTHAQDDLDGEKLFKNNCATCHKPTKEELAAPGLKGVQDRWEPDRELLYEWVRNPRKVADMGNAYVDEMVAKWKPKYGMMNPQSVSNEEIDAILAYVKNYEPPKEEQVAQKEGEQATGTKESDCTVWLLLLAVILLIVIFSLNSVRRSLLDAVREREGLSPVEDKPATERVTNWMKKHKSLTAFIVIIVLCGLFKAGWDALMGIGVYQGYQPAQPIKFPHDIHAGKNDIACVYCHTGARKSRHAMIPSPGICMNCHEQINEGPRTGKKEIQKLYAATGWNPKTRQYSGETKPIEWVKVHNLPDFAYFNHSQHVVVGELECQECHGKVEEMGVAKQHSKLTMGWCINCHEETEVKMADNGYYQEVKERLPSNLMKQYMKDEKITVKELGGWECVKCHY